MKRHGRQKLCGGLTVFRGHAGDGRDERAGTSGEDVPAARRIINKEGITMQIKSRMLLVIVILCLAVGFLAAPGLAAQDVSKEAALPRAFQGVSLGMPLSDFVAVVPDAKRVSLARQDQSERTVMVPSKDRALQRVEYRFYKDRLREVTIHYNPGEVPGGYRRLIERLRESYGKPIEENLEDYATDPKILSLKKTIWKDSTTMATLAEFQTVIDDRGKLSLTLTDLELHQAFEQDQEQRRRERELRIPIPLPQPPIQERQAAAPHPAHVAHGHVRG